MQIYLFFDDKRWNFNFSVWVYYFRISKLHRLSSKQKKSASEGTVLSMSYISIGWAVAYGAVLDLWMESPQAELGLGHSFPRSSCLFILLCTFRVLFNTEMWGLTMNSRLSTWWPLKRACVIFQRPTQFKGTLAKKPPATNVITFDDISYWTPWPGCSNQPAIGPEVTWNDLVTL